MLVIRWTFSNMLTIGFIIWAVVKPVITSSFSTSPIPATSAAAGANKQRQDKNAKIYNATRILDELLENYDRWLRPDFGGPPTFVEVNLHITSMGPISEFDMDYQMDCYFRQSWVDSRLQFNSSLLNLTSLQVSVSVLDKLWKPDTHFLNGKHSYLHNVTTPNKLLRITGDGRILYSMRLTIKATCPMHLENFPMDEQKCPLTLGSHGYSSDDLIYIWTRNVSQPIRIVDNMMMSQFDIIGFPVMNASRSRNGRDMYSILQVDFHLRRSTGFFLINVYVPCSLLVILSWVGFWINREATSDRIALGVMTVLTMTFVAMEHRRDMPRVSYSTALDYFVGACFVFVLATIIEFSCVHYFTKYGSGEPIDLDSDDSDAEESGDNIVGGDNKAGSVSGPTSISRSNKINGINSAQSSDCLQEKQTQHYGSNNGRNQTSIVGHLDQPPSQPSRPVPSSSSSHRVPLSTQPGRRRNFCCDVIHCLLGSASYRRRHMLIDSSSKKLDVNSVSRIDRLSRVIFPIGFLAYNICYWTLYLRIAQRTYLHK